MLPGSLVVLTLLAYLCGLFVIARFGETTGRRFVGERGRSVIYALSLGVYCTSWTFFGSVGLASSRGLEFVTIYIGPIVVFGLLFPLLQRIARLAKSQNIVSIADFVSARYGKAGAVAALVAIIAVVGIVPYIALQLKAVSAALATVFAGGAGGSPTASITIDELAAVVAVALAGFAMAFGTRRLDATEHHDGLMLAIAAESIVKLVAFLVVGGFVTWGLFDGLADLTRRVAEHPDVAAVIGAKPDIATWLVEIVLAGFAILLLPRQFHVAIVENRRVDDIRKAAWMFPLYILAINLFVVPIAIAGLLTFPDGAIDRDLTVLTLPLQAQSGFVVLTTLIGGFSASTAMVIVAAIALAIMVSNDLVMPFLIRLRRTRALIERGDASRFILGVRHCAILGVLGLAYLYYLYAETAALASIGLLSFACIAQIAPAFIGGLVWRRANARGAIAGLATGFGVWLYCLLVPSLDRSSPFLAALLANGPLGLDMLRPTHLFGVDASPLVHGVLFSLAANIAAFVGFSLTRAANPIERLQAELFMRPRGQPMPQTTPAWRGNVTMGQLETTVARYLGAEHTRGSFERFLAARDHVFAPAAAADVNLIRYGEHLVASAIGSASSRLVISLLLERRALTRKSALKLVDEVSAEIQNNRDLLQYAIDFARQGLTVFDRDLRLICWNREFRDLFDLPSDLLRIGIGLDDIIRFNAERGLYGSGPSEDYIAGRLATLLGGEEPLRLRIEPLGRVLEVRSARLPAGGLVVTYTDATAQVESEAELEAANELLERRVRERTEELERLNAELARAKSEADKANLSKTRFLAAASHDVLQPLNAARLYTSSLSERLHGRGSPGDPAETIGLIDNVDASLEAVEDILTALLDISRLDAGGMTVERAPFAIDDLLDRLRHDFEPLARDGHVNLVFVGSSLGVLSDRRLLRRLLQNLVSNAIKYSPGGKVLVGVRRREPAARIEIWDTGIGIPPEQQKAIFREFARLEPAVKKAPGVGLGLSIVERLSAILGHAIDLRSAPERGSVFGVTVPLVEAAPRAKPSPGRRASSSLRPLTGMLVAAVDNEPAILAGMAILIETWGCCFAGGADETSLRTALDGRMPDVLIADYHLDADDGLALIDRVRATFRIDLPAVLLTADYGTDLRERAQHRDVQLLNKPLKPAALRALLSQWRAAEVAAE